MQNNIRKAFVAALLAVAAFGVSLAAPGGAAPGMPRPPGVHPGGVATATSVKTTTARLGSLRREDTVVVAVEGVVDSSGIDSNTVQEIAAEYCGTNVMPRVGAVESGLSGLEEWQRTNAVPRIEGLEEWQRTNGLYSAVAGLGDSVSAALATKADGTVVERGVYSPAMDTNDVWVVDVDGTVLRFSDADPAAGTVTWRGVCASNTLWVSGSATSAPPEVAYSLTTLETGATRVLASVDVVDAATGARCGIPRSAFGGTGDDVAYLAPGYDQAGPGDIQYSYSVAVRPLGSGALVFYRTDSGVPAEVVRLSRSRVVDAETSVVYDADLRRRLAELRAAAVSRDAATSGFTEWAVSTERPVTGEVVVAAFPAGSAPSGVCDWSLFYADDAVRDDSTRLASVKRASSAATNLAWAASETSWGISVTACRVRVPTVADIEGVQAAAGKHYDDASAMFAKLLHYATNNYYSAYLANERAKNLEAWQYTNAVGRADVERGMTDWAMTPMWPIGYVDAGQVLDGPDAGKWSLFPTGATHTASNALLPAIDGAKNSFGDVVELLWPDASWRVEERWTNSLDKLGLRWTPDPGNGYVTAHFDARATRTRVVTTGDLYSLSTNMAQAVTGLVGGVSERLDRLGADLASAARLSLPGECFPVTYMAGSSPPVTIRGADGLSFREDGGVVRMGDAAAGRYICAFDVKTLRFKDSPYGEGLLFGRGYELGVSNEWPVLSVSVCGTPVATEAALASAIHTNADGTAVAYGTALVPATRTVNGKALTNDVALSAADVGVGMEESSDGQAVFLTVDGTEVSVQRALPVSYSDGVLREQAELSIRTDAGDRAAWESAVADIWLSSFDGDDANDGLSPASAVKTIAGAYNAAYTAVTNGTLNASNEIVVAVAEGRYAPCVIYSALTNGIAYIATGDREDTIIDGMMATNGTRALGSPHNRTVAVGVRMACPDILYSVSMRGFTLTRFNHYYHGSHDVRSQVIYGIKFSKCDFVANDAMVREDSAFASGIFDECDFHGNRLQCWRQYAVESFFGGNSGWSIYGDDVILSRCHVWDNDMSICAYLMRSPSNRQREVSRCLLEVDFYEYYGRPGGGNNTIIAKTFSNPHVTGLTHNKDGQFNTGSFIVVAEPGPGYTDSIYRIAGSCVVSNANLTADFVAADTSCPSVRGNGLPDFGYRDSGLSGVIAAGRTADLDERIALQPAMYSDRPTFTEWEYSGLDSRFTVLRGPRYYPQYGGWYCDEVADAASGSSYEAYAPSDDANATNLVMGFEDEWGTNFTFTATRLRTDVTGYALGPQTNKVLASTLAVDRLWDRSTNSFLKAQWENGDSSGSRLVESDAGIDFYYRDGDWRRRSRWDVWGLEVWGDEYVTMTGMEAAGLWVGADPYGDNNIWGGGFTGYCNGGVALGRPDSYEFDWIYFPTGVGGGRDNVFALTKDIDRATNALSASLSAQIDTESPLLARSYTVTPRDATWAYERAGGSPIYFRPRYFGMRDGDLFKGAVIRTKDSYLTPFPTVYMRVKRFSDGAVLGVSDAVSYPNTPDTDVVFQLPRAVALASKDSYYTLDFATTPDGDAIAAFGMRIYYLNGGSGSNPDCYLQSQAFVPVMTAQFYSWASVVAPSAAAEEGQLANAKATGEALDAKASRSDVDPLLFAQYYPDGSVKSAAEFTQGIKYDAPDTTNRTITVKPFCYTDIPGGDNSDLEGRVVVPPFVDAQGNGYVSDDGTRYRVVGVRGCIPYGEIPSLTAVVAPNTVTNIEGYAFFGCTSLASVSLPAATAIGGRVFSRCTSLASVSLPVAQAIGSEAFFGCTSLASVSLPAATTIGDSVFSSCTSLASVSLPAATAIGDSVFSSCTSLASVSLPVAQAIGSEAFRGCTSLASVSLPAATAIGGSVFRRCTSLASVDFGDTPRSSVPTLGEYAFEDVPTSCKIIVPDAQYDAWTAQTIPDPEQEGETVANPWYALVPRYEFLRSSGWEYARRYEVDKQSGDPATTNVLTFAYDINSNRTAVTVGVPRHNDPGFEAEVPTIDGTTGETIMVPALVGPHSLAITGDDESDRYIRTVASGVGSIAVNKGVATNRFSVALGYNTFAAGEAAVSHGCETSALGDYSHSEGQAARAVGRFSHAEGEATEARGCGSHVEGVNAEVDGKYAHAEGNNTRAEGDYSHAEGVSTCASGVFSHAEGNESHAVGHSAHSDGINAHATNATSYVWQGASAEDSAGVPYKPGAYYSHGIGTYNVNPNGGLAGFWVGETNLAQHVANLTAGKLDKSGGIMTGDITVVPGVPGAGVGRDAITTVTIAGRKYGALECEAGGISPFGEIIACAQGYSSLYAKSADVARAIDPANAVFSNAVLAVGFNVDTNTVAAINALLAESGEDGLPVGGVAATGALLAALAAAIAALKRKSGTVTSPLRMLGEDGAWYLVGVDSSGEFYVRKEGSEPAFQPADPDDPELAGTISTEGELNDDNTLTVEGEVNEDGTLSVEV